MTAGPAARQLALDLPFEEGLGIDDFLVAASNRHAWEAVMAWPRWPATALLLQGPDGSGKTHLGRIWARRSGAVAFEPAQLWDAAGPLARLGAARAALVDPADEVEDERQLLHLYNLLAERGGSLLLTTRVWLGAPRLRLADLRSRLATGWHVTIGPPCDALIEALLVKQLADRQLRVEPEVLSYLLPRMERSFAAVRQLVGALDRTSLRARRPIRQPLARDVLRALTGDAPDDQTEARGAGVGRHGEWISA
jgi:chromosomal replication initiation ATPase DnaA